MTKNYQKATLYLLKIHSTGHFSKTKIILLRKNNNEYILTKWIFLQFHLTECSMPADWVSNYAKTELITI